MHHFWTNLNDHFQIRPTVMAVAGVLLFWASWLRLVGELQQNGMFPRRTKAAVADSQQNLQLIKSALPLLQVDSRVGWCPLNSPAEHWQWRGRFSLVTITLCCAATTWQGHAGLDPQLHPKTITCLSTWNAATFDRSVWAYISPDALFMLPVWRWHEWVMGPCKEDKR